MTSTPTAPPKTLAALLQQQADARLPDPARRREIRASARLSRADIAAALRAEGHTVTVASVAGWERPRSDGGWDPRRERAVAYRKLLERIEAAVAGWAGQTADAAQK